MNAEEYQGETDTPNNLIEHYKKTLPENHNTNLSEGAL